MLSWAAASLHADEGWGRGLGGRGGWMDVGGSGTAIDGGGVVHLVCIQHSSPERLHQLVLRPSSGGGGVKTGM